MSSVVFPLNKQNGNSLKQRPNTQLNYNGCSHTSRVCRRKYRRNGRHRSRTRRTGSHQLLHPQRHHPVHLVCVRLDTKCNLQQTSLITNSSGPWQIVPCIRSFLLTYSELVPSKRGLYYKLNRIRHFVSEYWFVRN